MSAKHTEGPWRSSRAGTFEVYSGNKLVACCDTEDVLGDRMKAANARLIAAAPEMLAALREIHEIMEEAMHPDAADTEIDLCDLIGTASRAIAKATGEA